MVTRLSNLSSLKKTPRSIFLNNLRDEGVVFLPRFFDSNSLLQINKELDSIFKNNIVYNSNYSGCIYISKAHKEVAHPIKTINSINLLELSISVFKVIRASNPSFHLERYILTNIEIFSESKNHKELFWHTDQRRGMLRAQIYLRGGGKTSGGFKYMRQTHAVDHGVDHKLTNPEIQSLNHLIIDMSGSPGDLVIFDSFGFHAKHLCFEERRTIMFEFQDFESNHKKSSLLIDNKKFTDLVLSNLKLFKPGKLSTYGIHGLDVVRIMDLNISYFLSKIFPALDFLNRLLTYAKRLIVLLKSKTRT